MKRPPSSINIPTHMNQSTRKRGLRELIETKWFRKFVNENSFNQHKWFGLFHFYIYSRSMFQYFPIFPATGDRYPIVCFLGHGNTHLARNRRNRKLARPRSKLKENCTRDASDSTLKHTRVFCDHCHTLPSNNTHELKGDIVFDIDP